MRARCRLRVCRTIPPAGFTSRRRWSWFPIHPETTVRGLLMLSIRGNHRRDARATAFTLAEGMMAVVVLAMAVGAMMGPLTASYQQTRTVKQTTTAISMAQQLLDEILSKPFVDPTDLSTTLGPEADELNRTAFDNI